jgi:hypothetical protein
MRSGFFFIHLGDHGMRTSDTALQLEKTIELPDVQGPIDLVSLDVKGQRLFVAAAECSSKCSRFHALTTPRIELMSANCKVLDFVACDYVFLRRFSGLPANCFDNPSQQLSMP